MQQKLLLLLAGFAYMANSAFITYSPTQLTNLKASIVCSNGQFVSVQSTAPYVKLVTLASPGE